MSRRFARTRAHRRACGLLLRKAQVEGQMESVLAGNDDDEIQALMDLEKTTEKVLSVREGWSPTTKASTKPPTGNDWS